MMNCGGTLDVVDGNSPVLIERPAPYTKVTNFHDDPSNQNVCSNNFDSEMLFEAETGAIVSDSRKLLGRAALREVVVE